MTTSFSYSVDFSVFLYRFLKYVMEFRIVKELLNDTDAGTKNLEIILILVQQTCCPVAQKSDFFYMYFSKAVINKIHF